MRPQVSTVGLSHGSATNDALVNYDATASTILTAAKNAPATAVNDASPVTILSTATARLRLHSTATDEPSLRSKSDDAGRWGSSPGLVLTTGSGLGLSIL